MITYLLALLLSLLVPFGMTERAAIGESGAIAPYPGSEAVGPTLKNAATAMEVHYVENQTYAGATLDDLYAQGLQVEDGVRLTIVIARTDRYCLEATSAEGDTSHYDSDAGTPEPGRCS